MSHFKSFQDNLLKKLQRCAAYFQLESVLRQDRHGTAKMADFGLSCTSARSDSSKPQHKSQSEHEKGFMGTFILLELVSSSSSSSLSSSSSVINCHVEKLKCTFELHGLLKHWS